ncbi:hypothetical protein H310_08347 [Aphanomyces invadans]|uniref:Homeobox domain-containing protein n=1 Tax=Aphanomyces invadans TaxID=157072 RepID=A0A024TYZ9_9STRA|nr:hypothetical protein H310_08347 [Aphanomyces invadans]ETV98846.1 hypothetical protein H310_08347 [Aphanomyces invadans]|eukprot:XP_008872274.1 hypothetical protein H310_08347 [Aphanomyces invadans]
MAPPSKHEPSSPAGATDGILVDESSTVHFSKKAVEYLRKRVLEEKLTGLKADVERRQEIALRLNCPESRVTNWIRNFTQTLKKNDLPSRAIQSSSPKSAAADSTKSQHVATASSTAAVASPSATTRDAKPKGTHVTSDTEAAARRRLTLSPSANTDVAVHVTKEPIGEPNADALNVEDDDGAATPSKTGVMPPPEDMTGRDRIIWRKQLRATLKRTLDALEELGCPSIYASFDPDTHAGTYETRGAIAVHATEHVRNIHDVNLETLLPDIAVIRRQFPALYPPPPNPLKQQEKVWTHVLGALNDELRRMGQPTRKQMPWHALVSGTIGVKARHGTEKRKFELVNWPTQVPKRKKLDSAQCALLLQNLPAIHVAIADAALTQHGETGGNDDDVVVKECEDDHDDEATEDGGSPHVALVKV